MDYNASHTLTLVMHNQHIFKAVEVAEYFGVKQKQQDVENAVRVILYLSESYPECTVTIDNESRVNLLIHGAPTPREFELLDQYVKDAGLESVQQILKIRGCAPVYTVHSPGFTIIFEADGPGFTFPLKMTVIAWTDMSEPGSHSDHCRYHEDEYLDDCECEPIEDYRNTLKLESHLAFDKFVHAFLAGRDEPIGAKMGVGPRAGGRIFD